MPVRIASPTGLPGGAPESWTLTDGSRLSAPTFDATVSTLGAPTAVDDEFAEAVLSVDQPLTITSEPGTTTLLRFSVP